MHRNDGGRRRRCRTCQAGSCSMRSMRPFQTGHQVSSSVPADFGAQGHADPVAPGVVEIAAFPGNRAIAALLAHPARRCIERGGLAFALNRNSARRGSRRRPGSPGALHRRSLPATPAVGQQRRRRPDRFGEETVQGGLVESRGCRDLRRARTARDRRTSLAASPSQQADRRRRDEMPAPMRTRASHWNPGGLAAMTSSASKSSQRELVPELRSVPCWRIRVTLENCRSAGSTCRK